MRFFTLFITLLISMTFAAQSVFNTTLLQKIEEGNISQKLKVFVLLNPNTEIEQNSFPDLDVHYKVGNIYCATTSLETIKLLGKIKNVQRVEFSNHHYELMGDTCMVRNRIKSIKLGLTPLVQAYDGTGVIVGIIDSGTDFNHPDFKDASGNSRINYLWDMNKPLAINTPTTFGYGQEWNNIEIDNGQCTHDDLASYGHGTASSGIAAGNGLAINHFEGVAPKADIIVVALDFNDPNHTIADAVQYIFDKAQQVNKPVVINASVGDYYGSHDGTDLEAQIIDNMITAQPARALVASAGNAGNVPFHLGINVTTTDTNFTWIQKTGTITNDMYADTSEIKNVKFSIGVNNLSFNDLGAMPFRQYNYALNSTKSDTVFHNAQRIGIIENTASINTFGVYQLSIKIIPDSNNYYWRMQFTGSGRIDSWNFDYLTNGLPTASQYAKMPFYRKADTLQTIVSSFQCSAEVITVGNYVNRNRYTDVNGNNQLIAEIPGEIAASSSIGPTRRNMVKPNITASGATILTSAALGLLPNLIANAPQVVAQGGFHITAGGTSASSPVVAGFAALYLQKKPTATNREIRDAIINCAYNDVFTTTLLPNNRWGYGKLDGFKSMTCSTKNTNLEHVNVATRFSVHPNPVADEALVTFENNSLKRLKLFDANGSLVLSENANGKHYTFKKNNLAPGLYLLMIADGTEIYKLKIIII